MKQSETFEGWTDEQIVMTVADAMTPDDSPDEKLAGTSARFRRHRAYQDAWEAWYSTLSAADQALLRQLKMHQPVAEQFGRVNHEEQEEPEAEVVAVEVVESDLADLEVSIEKALRWALEGRDLVEIGRRWAMVMRVWRSPLIAGLAIEFEREALVECAREVGTDDDGSAAPMQEWGMRGSTWSQIGQRVMAIGYVLWPAMIGSLTLAQIGRMKNRTRQAIDKLVQDFRDTFGGVKNSAMRDDENRLICQNAQLQRAS